MANAEIQKLSDLLELSQSLGSTLNLKSAMSRVLEILEEHHRTTSSSIVLLDEQSGDLTIEASTGMSWQTARRTSARPRSSGGTTAARFLSLQLNTPSSKR